MEGVIAETAPATTVASRGRAPEAPWTAPLGTGRLAALLFLTCGVYSLFYMYKVARDLRDHADARVTPWLYPLSIFIGLASAIASGRLASLASSMASPATRRPSCSGGLVGGLVFVAHVVVTISGSVISEIWWIAGLLLFTLPWLLVESQLTAIKLGTPNVSYRARPHRFTKLQWVAAALGTLLWGLILYGLLPELARWRGTELEAAVPYEEPLGRFSVVPPQRGWVLVAPGTVVDDAELELLGPGISQWAVAHVTEQAGWDLDTVVQNRYAEIRTIDEDVRLSEKRELEPGTSMAVSLTTYRGRDAIDGPFVFHVAAFVTEQRAVELIVYSAGTASASNAAEQLARSLTPANRKETAVGL
jgi:hypothetical protein